MRRLLMTAVFAACILTLGGCDFLRSLAGRPTSRDIALKREEILRKEAEAAARADSLALVRAAQEAEAAASAELEAMGLKTREVSTLRDAGASGLDSRYYIVIGAFGNRSNATRLASVAGDAGCSPVLVDYRSGTMTAVAVCPSATKRELYDNLQRVRAMSFCPSDVWILINE